MTNALLTPSPKAKASPAGGAGEPASNPTHRVVLVDPREDRRAIMNFLVDQCPLLTVVGLAGDVAEAASQIRAEQAQVVLVEIQMPVAAGLAAIAALRDEFPDLRIVVCSFFDNAETRQAARAAGADGYLAKPPSARDLIGLVVGPPPVPPDADPHP